MIWAYFLNLFLMVWFKGRDTAACDSAVLNGGLIANELKIHAPLLILFGLRFWQMLKRSMLKQISHIYF